MNADVTPIKDTLVGIWLLDAAGMQSHVSLSPDGKYNNTLVGGSSAHSGTWAVSNNPFGGQTVTFTLAAWYPKEYVGPLGTVPITWPKTEAWHVTGVQPDQILIEGGTLRRLTPEMAAAGASIGPNAHSVGAFSGLMSTTDYNAEMEKEMRQIADAGRKVFNGFMRIFQKR